jgi:hypothetical protein
MIEVSTPTTKGLALIWPHFISFKTGNVPVRQGPKSWKLLLAVESFIMLFALMDYYSTLWPPIGSTAIYVYSAIRLVILLVKRKEIKSTRYPLHEVKPMGVAPIGYFAEEIVAELSDMAFLYTMLYEFPSFLFEAAIFLILLKAAYLLPLTCNYFIHCWKTYQRF